MSWVEVAKVEDLPQEEEDILSVELEGRVYIALIKLGGKIHAVNNVCTHEFALLSDGIAEENYIECPLHQARFDVNTGERLSGPACSDLAVYPIKTEDGTVYIDLGA